MPIRHDPAQRGQLRGARLTLEVGASLRAGRHAAGLNQRIVARRSGISQTRISRVERGVGNANLRELATVAAIVGLDLVVRLFPGGAPVRDVAHVRLLQRLRAAVAPGAATNWQTEVPMPGPGDQRAVDAVAFVGDTRIGFELETRLTDAQATTRRSALKQRDAGLDRMILVLADTRANRDALAVAAPTLGAAFPLQTRAVVAALRAGHAPGANGIIVV